MQKTLTEKVLKSKSLHYVLALCIMSTLFPFVPYSRFIALSAMLFMVLMNSYKGFNKHTILFWCWVMLCSVINGVWGIRDVALTVVVFSAVPMIGHSRLSDAVLRAFLNLLPLFVIANLVAHVLGINYFHILFNEPRKFCFSGLTMHPQWLGGFTGMASVYLYYHIVSDREKKIWVKIMLAALLLLSLELGVLAASRSALMATALSIAVMTFMSCRNRRELLRIAGIGLLLLVIMLPLFLESTDMIKAKQMDQQKMGMSRSRLWMQQFLLIKNNLLFGTGLRNGESGNGWFSVASQSGIIGLALMLNILLQGMKTMRKHISEKPAIILTCGLLVYLTIHCCFEGYILTPGYLGCWVFWAILGRMLAND